MTMYPRLQASLLVLGLSSGVVASFLQGCIIPDYCFVTYSAGEDWCRPMVGALMWPAGLPGVAVPVLADDDSVPTGCRCMNDAEREIMITMSPEADYIALSGELAIEARLQCAALVPEGFEHNCMLLEGPQSSSIDAAYAGPTSYDCAGSCTYENPPPGKECPEPDPYQCNDQIPPGNDDEAGTEESTDEGGVVVLTDLPRAP